MNSQLDKIQEMFNLQNTLNKRTAGDSWFDRPDVVFENAIIAEAAELLESLDYKWWKHGEVDYKNARVEIVDLWHFTMSHIMKHYGRDEQSIELIAQACVEPFSVAPCDFSQDYLLRKAVHNYVFEVLDITNYIGFVSCKRLLASFGVMMNHAGMSLNDLYSMYIIKNALNKFRQDNGYTTGEYVKTWAGKEDNEVVMEHCKGLTFEQTLVKMQALYNSLKDTA